MSPCTIQTLYQTRPHFNSFLLPFSLAGLGQPQGEARPDGPQPSESGGGAEAVVEPAKVAPDLRAKRRLDTVLEVGQARGGIGVGPAIQWGKGRW